MKQSLAMTAAATLMAGLLAGCGGGDGGGGDAGGDYCDRLASAKEDFESLDSGDFAGFEEAIATIHELADEAPDEVAADWETLEGAIDQLETALDDAGIEISDLEAMSRGEMPEGVDPSKLASLGEDLQAMGSEEFETASTNIEEHAKDECDIDLSESSS